MKKKRSNNDKWGKKQVFVIEAIPYNQEICVILNGQFSDFIKLMKKQKTDSAKLNILDIEKSQRVDETAYIDNYVHNSGSAFTYTELPKGYVTCLSHQDSWIKSVECVVHECLHLTHYILRNAGMTLCKESEEAYTYLQQSLVTEILKRMY